MSTGHEVLLAQGVRFAGVVGGRGAKGEWSIGCGPGGRRGEGRGGRKLGLRIRVFGRGGMVRTASEELVAVDGGLLFGLENDFSRKGSRNHWSIKGQVRGETNNFFTVFSQVFKRFSIAEEVGTEGFDTFLGFFLLRGVELFFGQIGIFIESSRKRSQGCSDLA